MPRASRMLLAQTSTLKPGGSLILLTGSLSAAVGIGCAATGAIFIAASVFGRPAAQNGSSSAAGFGLGASGFGASGFAAGFAAGLSCANARLVAARPMHTASALRRSNCSLGFIWFSLWMIERN